jgi:hypothetical protein
MLPVHAAGVGDPFEVGELPGLYGRADDTRRRRVDHDEDNFHVPAACNVNA